MDRDTGDGFPAAFDFYAPAILRYAQSRLDGQEAAWDVVTDTFTSALGISTSHVRKTGQEFLNFGATVWVGGPRRWTSRASASPARKP